MQMNEAKECIQIGLQHIRAGETEDAILCYRQAIRIAPERSAGFFASLGKQLIEQQGHEHASILFTDLKAERPDIPDGFLGLAQIARDAGQWQQALDYWEICFNQFANHIQPQWYIKKAEALLKLNLSSEAATLYQQFIHSYPNRVQGFLGMARVSQSEEKWLDALHYWDICFERFPQQVKPSWRTQKKRVLLKLGKIEEAQKEAASKYKSEEGQAYFALLDKKNKTKASSDLKFRSILIVTYGRSGSTLLQGILNTIDGVLVRGENANIFYDFYQTYKKLIQLKENYQHALLPNQPWYGMSFFDKSLLLRNYQELAKGILLADQYENEKQICFGFKEIRYTEVGEELIPYLEFLDKLFPNSALIFNTRNLEDVVKSAWWKDEDYSVVIEKLKSIESVFQEYCETHNNGFHITYENVIKNGEQLKELFSYLGAEYQADVVETVLATPHSYEPEQDKTKRIFEKF